MIGEGNEALHVSQWFNQHSPSKEEEEEDEANYLSSSSSVFWIPAPLCSFGICHHIGVGSGGRSPEPGGRTLGRGLRAGPHMAFALGHPGPLSLNICSAHQQDSCYHLCRVCILSCLLSSQWQSIRAKVIPPCCPTVQLLCALDSTACKHTLCRVCITPAC